MALKVNGIFLDLYLAKQKKLRTFAKNLHRDMFRQRKDIFRFCLMVLLLGYFGCSSQEKSENLGTEEEQHYDAMQLKGDWQGIISEAAEHPVQSLACHKMLQLARYYTGQISAREVMDACLSDSKEALTSVTGAMIMSDIYLQLGFASLAQRAAFEAMVVTNDEKLITRALQRLTETSIITGQYEVARKYMYILEERNVNSKWLKAIKPMVEHPGAILDNPTFNRMKEQYEHTEDQFFM